MQLRVESGAVREDEIIRFNPVVDAFGRAAEVRTINSSQSSRSPTLDFRENQL
jgi:hypothetical protein